MPTLPFATIEVDSSEILNYDADDEGILVGRLAVVVERTPCCYARGIEWLSIILCCVLCPPATAGVRPVVQCLAVTRHPILNARWKNREADGR